MMSVKQYLAKPTNCLNIAMALAVASLSVYNSELRNTTWFGALACIVALSTAFVTLGDACTLLVLAAVSLSKRERRWVVFVVAWLAVTFVLHALTWNGDALGIVSFSEEEGWTVPGAWFVGAAGAFVLVPHYWIARILHGPYDPRGIGCDGDT